MRYLHYDVFTDRLFEGNQLAVFPDAGHLSAAQMQTLAREMNFSESTFLMLAESPDTDIRMRIFTPGAELPMAGHPTIGTTFALAREGVIEPGRARWVFGLGVGPTPVELTWSGATLDFAWMDQRPPDMLDAEAHKPPDMHDAEVDMPPGPGDLASDAGSPGEGPSSDLPSTLDLEPKDLGGVITPDQPPPTHDASQPDQPTAPKDAIQH